MALPSVSAVCYKMVKTLTIRSAKLESNYSHGVFRMQIDDLRDFLDILEEYREVQRIDAEVDWNLEMARSRGGFTISARRRRCLKM